MHGSINLYRRNYFTKLYYTPLCFKHRTLLKHCIPLNELTIFFLVNLKNKNLVKMCNQFFIFKITTTMDLFLMTLLLFYEIK